MRDCQRGEFNVFGLGKQHLLPSSFNISFYTICVTNINGSETKKFHNNLEFDWVFHKIGLGRVLEWCYAAFLQPCEIKNFDIRGFNKNTAAIERERH